MSLSDEALRQRQLQGPRPLVTMTDPARFQPASIEVHLAADIMLPRRMGRGFRVDPRLTRPEECWDPYTMLAEGYWIPAGGIVKASTIERVCVPPDLEVILDGISSLGRWWITIHQTAGYGDPGFEGTYTLEMKNSLPWDFLLYPGMRIGQLRWQRVEGRVNRLYGEAGNHYQHQSGPTGSRYWQADYPLPEEEAS